MEFTKDIEFSKKLKENEESTITYKGYLYQKNSQEVTMVYGYGDSWDNTSNALMAKTDHGFEATINRRGRGSPAWPDARRVRRRAARSRSCCRSG